MKIDRMADLDGASKYGTCAECKMVSRRMKMH